MKTVNINKISAIFLGVVLLSSVLSSAAYAGEVIVTDLSIEKTSDQTTATPGDLWDFSVAVTNNSLDPAEFAEIVDPLGSNLEFVGASPDVCSLATSINTLFCFLPTLSTGEEFKVDITTRVKSTTPLGIEIPNTASVFGDSSASTPDDEDTITLMIIEGCVCDSLSIKPKLTSDLKWRIKGVVSKTNALVDVSIFMPWEVSFKCLGNSGTCVGKYDLLGIENPDWFADTDQPLPIPAEGNHVSHKHFRVSDKITEKNWVKIQDGPMSIDCNGECDGKTVVRDFVKTKYITKISNKDKNLGQTNLEVTGSIQIAIIVSDQTICPNSNIWEMTLEIDSEEFPGEKRKNKGTNTRVNVIDIDNSDFDGDGATNKSEAGPDNELGTADDTTDGLPNYLNPKIFPKK